MKTKGLLSRGCLRPKIMLLGVFVLCTCVGVMVGGYIRSQMGMAEAASENIVVVNNNQISSVDQGTPTITRTSTVTVKDTAATLGYTLKARIGNNSIPGSTVAVYSAASATCTQVSPCSITTDSTPTTILETNTTDATQVAGHTTDWTVTIILPANTPQGNYLVDIEYDESANVPPPDITTVTYMQEVTANLCADTADRVRTTLIDYRNSQSYYVQKINGTGPGGVGDLCWMESNLRYGGGGANTYGDAKSMLASSSSSYTAPYYYNPGGSTDYTNTAKIDGFYGYLYNWCAAMGGQSAACNSTSVSGFDTAISVCPAGWRLPIGNTDGEFQALNTVVNNGNWANDAGLRSDFLLAYAGNFNKDYNPGLINQGINGYLWSSTVESATNAYYMYASFPGMAAHSEKDGGFAVRCVLMGS